MGQARKDIETQDRIGKKSIEMGRVNKKSIPLGTQIVDMTKDDMDIVFSDVREVAEATNEEINNRENEMDKKDSRISNDETTI